jgi:hypothetical protein
MTQLLAAPDVWKKPQQSRCPYHVVDTISINERDNIRSYGVGLKKRHGFGAELRGLKKICTAGAIFIYNNQCNL